MQAKLERFAALVQQHQIEQLQAEGFTVALHLDSHKTSIKPGKKYTKIDIGTSGRYMVENDTQLIFGIKGYGVIHRGHCFGTLDEVDQWYWGGYYAHKAVK